VPTQIKINYTRLEHRRDEVDRWLKQNAGTGSVRYGGREGTIKHWLNGDDWLYYSEYGKDDEQLNETNVVFVFRDERVATEFALRFA
jgi:hypothetical protein